MTKAVVRYAGSGFAGWQVQPRQRTVQGVIEEALKTILQQNQALTQSDQASKNLAELSEDLKNSTDISKSAEEVASAAEELSSAVQEINRSASQLMAAIDQIRKGAEIQSASTEEASAAIAFHRQVERLATEHQALRPEGTILAKAAGDAFVQAVEAIALWRTAIAEARREAESAGTRRAGGGR